MGPSRAEVRASFSANFADDRLASGTVLIFPMHRVRAASLPPLPEPIPVLAQPQFVAAPSTPAGLATETAPAVDAPPTSIEAARYRGGRVAGFFLARGAVCRIAPAPPANVDAPSPQQLERTIFGAAAIRGAQMAGSPVRNVSRQEWDREERLSAERARSRPYIFFFVIAGTATLAIAFTIGSMGLRGLRSIRSRRQETAVGLVPPVPTFAELTPGNRILRVDVNQPQTRWCSTWRSSSRRRPVVRREPRRFRTTRRRPPELSQHVSGRGLSLSGTFERTCEPRCATLRPWAQLSFTTCAWRSCCWRWPARGWPTCSPCRAIG